MIAHRRRKNIASTCHGSVSRAARPRQGATLIEVLMSLLIMGIGVTSVISIFPIAWMRSIQATQLTNARMMRHNAEQLLRQPLTEGRVPVGTYPSPRFEYRVLNQSTFRVGVPGTIVDVDNQIFRGTWQPNTAYIKGQIVLATRREGELNPAQNRWFVCLGDVANGNPAGLSGYVEPNWYLTPFILPGGSIPDDTVDGQLVWECLTQAPISEAVQPVQVQPGPTGPVGPLYNALNYVVDPLGWNVYADEASDIFPTTDLVNDFGYKVDRVGGIANRATYDATNPLTWPLLRINGGAATTNEAAFIASHPDSWTVGTSSIIDVAASSPVTAVFPSKIDLSDVAPGDRIVLTSLTNTVGVTRTITSVTAPSTINWNLAEPLPAGFTADGPARIEKFNRLYTWLATVNKDLQGNSKVTVAVFAKRGFKPAEEHVYNANYGNTAVDQIYIEWTPGTEPDPLIRAGNYLLDGTYARWYRIVTVSGGNGAATITVDRPIPMAHWSAALPAVPGRAILMRGIVELFEL